MLKSLLAVIDQHIVEIKADARGYKSGYQSNRVNIYFDKQLRTYEIIHSK